MTAACFNAFPPQKCEGVLVNQEAVDSLETPPVLTPDSPRSVTYGAGRYAKRIEGSTESPSGVPRFQRKMRDVDAYIVWYLSEGLEPLPYPHSSIVANPGDLFIHRRSCDEVEKIWVMGKDGLWDEIVIGGKHPLLSGYRLHLLANRDPGWVTKKTATTYRGRQKRQANVVSNTFIGTTLTPQLTVRYYFHSPYLKL